VSAPQDQWNSGERQNRSEENGDEAGAPSRHPQSAQPVQADDEPYGDD